MRLMAAVWDSDALERPNWDLQSHSTLGPQHLSAGSQVELGTAAPEASPGRPSVLGGS